MTSETSNRLAEIRARWGLEAVETSQLTEGHAAHDISYLLGTIDDLTAEAERTRGLCSQVYHIVGVTAYYLGIFGTDDIEKSLDNLAAAGEGRPLPHKELLPWPSKPIEELRTDDQRHAEEQARTERARAEAAEARIAELEGRKGPA